MTNVETMMKVEVVRSPRRRKTVSARQVGDVVRVSVPATMTRAEEEHWVTEMLRRIKRRQHSAAVDLDERARGLAARFGLAAPKSARWVDNQLQRWGSCTPSDGTVRISSRLATEPPWVLDYVIVHELAHLEVCGHSKAFWDIVGRYPLAERARGFLIAHRGRRPRRRARSTSSGWPMRGRPPAAAKPGSAGRGLAVEGRLAMAALRGAGPPLPLETAKGKEVLVRAGPLSPGGRPVVTAQVQHFERGRVLSGDGAEALAVAAGLALERRLPLVAALTSSGQDLGEGVAALDGWGRAARAFSRCSGVVPVVAVLDGPLLSGPALLLGLADAVIMTPRALAYISGPAAVAEVTGVPVRPSELGGASVHSTRSGLATMVVRDEAGAFEAVGQLLGFLPAHCDELPPLAVSDDPAYRATPELADVVPAMATGSYDVRRVIAAIADDGALVELRAGWAAQLVTALVRVAGQPVGVLANQPQAMAGTLDIAASQKGARFVAFCDSFNLPLLTVVDTPGFMPGRDLEWRGMIRHGAELVFAYAEATVPRACLVLRKAYGGAYIVMDSKAMGNDLCIAWPSAEVAVMGAEGAVRIVHRAVDEARRAELAEEYREKWLNPYTAAERGYVDLVIDPAETRQTVARCFSVLESKRERLVTRKHANSPL